MRPESDVRVSPGGTALSRPERRGTARVTRLDRPTLVVRALRAGRVDLRSQNRLHERPVRGSRKYDPERLPSSRARLCRFHDTCGSFHLEF